LRPLRIILADDHEAVRQMLNLNLQGSDVEVVAQAENGREAVELVAKHHPDVVIMDVMMPDMDGIEATRVIKDQWPDVTVLGYSAAAHADSVDALLAAGASANYFKGDYQDLLKAVRATKPL
jgi:two-component system, NarL family, response regulator LiaR